MIVFLASEGASYHHGCRHHGGRRAQNDHGRDVTGTLLTVGEALAVFLATDGAPLETCRRLPPHRLRVGGERRDRVPCGSGIGPAS